MNKIVESPKIMLFILLLSGLIGLLAGECYGQTIQFTQIQRASGPGQAVITGTNGALSYTNTLPASLLPAMTSTLYVPYTGATGPVDLGANGITAQNFITSGTAGAGYIYLKAQAGGSPPAPALAGINLYSNNAGNLMWVRKPNIGTDVFTRTFVGTNTANRNYTFKDADGTIAFITDIPTYSAASPLFLSSNTFSIQQATTGQSGFLSSSDFNTFNNKLDASTAATTYVPLSRTLTINGVSQDLSSNRTWTVGDALTSNPLSQFASTTSSQLAGVVSDETGSGNLVFNGSPNLTGTTTAASAILSGSLTVGTTSLNSSGFGSARFSQGSAFVDLGERTSGEGTIWLGPTANTNANYAFTSTGTALSVNGTNSVTFRINATNNFALTSNALTFMDGVNFVFGTTTGTKFGTATTQKIGFFNATPIVQPGATTDLGTALSNLGLRASGTAYPITTSGAIAFSGTTAHTNASNTFRHISGNTAVASSTLGAGAGTAPTSTLTGCTDMAGLIQITTGTTPGSSATLITVTFGAAYTAAPNIILTPANANAAALSGNTQLFPTGNTGTFLITTGTVGLTAATVYKWYYQIIQ